ncbi:MAG: cytochrome P450 [Cyanobacteriota bacterium]|nr:cytochrome P450 [Cyanobacteriota bacterium]
MKLPNGPKTPKLIQLIRFILFPMSFLEDCGKRYGDIFTLHLTYISIVIISNPKALEKLLNGKEFTAPGEANKVIEPLVGSNSVITIDGEKHRRQRKLLMPPFHGDRMLTYGDTINNVTQEIITDWEVGKPFNVREAMQKITLRVIMQAVFGLYKGKRAEEIENHIKDFLEVGGSRLGTMMLFFPKLQQNIGSLTTWKNFVYHREQADKLLYQEIDERRENFDDSRTDILSMLMASRDEQGEAMTDEELRDELMTLLFAGHETTATALTWALYWIHKLPEVKEKLLAELATLGENPDSNAILKLPYLNAVYCETLRIYPVAILTFRRAIKSPVSLCGYELEPGVGVMGSIYSIHQNEDLYPEPKKFRPERFLERQFSPYEFIPFGGGTRRCIGMALAQFEMKLILARILSDLDLNLVTEGEVKPKRRGVVTGPNRPIEMVVNGKRVAKSRSLQTVG